MKNCYLKALQLGPVFSQEAEEVLQVTKAPACGERFSVGICSVSFRLTYGCKKCQLGVF